MHERVDIAVIGAGAAGLMAAIFAGRTAAVTSGYCARITVGMDTGLISVPSAINRTGDFSDIANSLTGTVNGQHWADRLTQRLGYAVTPGEPYYTAGCASSAQCVLPGARIPQSA